MLTFYAKIIKIGYASQRYEMHLGTVCVLIWVSVWQSEDKENSKTTLPTVMLQERLKILACYA